MTFFSLQGKVAIVTGGSSGIGEATVRRFAKDGAFVVIASRRDASALANEVSATYICTDVASEEDVANLVKATIDKFGHIDILVSNAGYWGETADITDQPSEDYLRNYEVNTLGTVYCIKHAAPHMPPGSAIVCVTSLSSVIGLPGYGAYTASKWAASGVVRCATMELGPKGIRVNEVCPTSTNTPMLQGQENMDIEVALTTTAAAIGNLVQPEEIAALIHFLAAGDCPTLTGQQISVDGGMTVGFSASNIDAILVAKGFA